MNSISAETSDPAGPTTAATPMPPRIISTPDAPDQPPRERDAHGYSTGAATGDGPGCGADASGTSTTAVP